MNQLPPQTVKRIESEAIEKYCSPYGKANPETYAYIEGATAEALRSKELVRVITEEINPSELPMHIADKLKQALKNYQQ